jgi:RHS repeat-associated protein
MRLRRDYTWSGTSWALSTEVRYVYDGMLIVQERSSGNHPQVTYTRGTDLSGTLEGAGGIGGLLSRGAHAISSPYQMSSAAHYHADGNGNVTMLVGTGSPTIKAYYKYDPFGRTLGSSGSLVGVNAMRFSSKPVMGSSELYYYGYRFYDPSSQRWLNRDPIGERGGGNLYGFVYNNPIQYFDRYGLIPEWIRKCGKAIVGPGMLCVHENCKGIDLSKYTYLAEKEPPDKPGSGEGMKKPRHLPGPGNCVHADAMYQPGGAYKIKDGQGITIDCASGAPKATGATEIFWKFGNPNPPVADWPDSSIRPYPDAPPVAPLPPLNPYSIYKDTPW